LAGGGDGWPAHRTRESPCRQATLGLMSAEDYCSLLSRIAANVSEKEVRWQGKEQENRRAGDRRISQLIRYLVALRLARGLPCVRSPRWSWAAIPHASSRVRPPHKSYQHPHLQYLLFGPHEQSWCVCVCLARSAAAILAYVRIIRLITVGASVVVSSRTTASYCCEPVFFTHPLVDMA
jgi:hypothetical protein